MENNNSFDFKNVDKAERNRLVEENMGLVRSIVRRYAGRGTDVEDLVQIGAIGLIKAVSNFNPEYNVKLSTYAVPMITGEIKRFLRDDGPIKVSRRLKETAVKARHCEEQLRRELGREPTIGEVSGLCEIPAEEILTSYEACTAPESIYETVYDNISIIDSLSEEGPEESIVNRVMAEELLKALSPRERQVLVLRYIKGKTQTEISKIIGVSQVQVSRIEKKTLLKIKNSTENII